MINLHVNILCNILSVFGNRNQFKNNLCDELLCVFYNNLKSPVIATQNPVNQLFIFRVMCNDIVHVMDQTGKLD